MQDHGLVTHGLHWLTLSDVGWKCAHPDCSWVADGWRYSTEAQDLFNVYHAKLSEAAASVQT